MRFILIGLVFYLLVTAYFAAQRVIRKRQLAKTASSASTQPMPFQAGLSRTSSFQTKAIDSSVVDPSITGGAIGSHPAQATLPQATAASSTSEAAEELVTGVAEAEPYAAEKPTSEPTAPDLSAPALVAMAPEAEVPAMMAPPIEGSPTGESAASPVLPIGSPIIIDPDKNLTLAVSLSVTDVVHPDTAAVEVPDFIPTDPAISEVLNAQAEPTHAHHPSILEEIAELRPMADAVQVEDPARRCMYALQTGDGTVRVAAVYELGELAAQRHGSEAKELIEQLQILTEDEDPDVRLQAIAALAKVQR